MYFMEFISPQKELRGARLGANQMDGLSWRLRKVCFLAKRAGYVSLDALVQKGTHTTDFDVLLTKWLFKRALPQKSNVGSGMRNQATPIKPNPVVSGCEAVELLMQPL